MAAIEIYGKKGCPFAWRVRLVAAEKGVPFTWLPFDVEEPDPRALRNNPDRKSPLIRDGEFDLTESEVIAWYLDEAKDGRPLHPAEPRERARMRLQIAELGGVKPDGPPGEPLSAKSRERIEKGFARLDELLQDGRAFLGGAEPALSDLLLWPMVAALESRDVPIAAERTRARAWWERSKARKSFAATRP